MRVMICLGQGGLRSLSASSFFIFFARGGGGGGRGGSILRSRLHCNVMYLKLTTNERGAGEDLEALCKRFTKAPHSLMPITKLTLKPGRLRLK